MKNRILLIAQLLFVNFLVAQVGISTSTPHASAELDVTSSTRGLLIPRLTTAAINTLTATASEGLMVFDTTKKQFLGYNGTSWQVLSTTNWTTTFASWELSSLPGGSNNYGGSPLAATVTSQVTSANLTRGSGITTTGSGAASAWGGNGFDTTATTAAAAITSNEYFSITVVLPSTNTFYFSKISPYNIRRSSSGPNAIQWQYSVNGGAYTDIGSVITPISDTSATGNSMSEVSLSSISALQNLTNVTVVFRMVMYGATNVGGTFYLNNFTGNDLEIVGTYN